MALSKGDAPRPLIMQEPFKQTVGITYPVLRVIARPPPNCNHKPTLTLM